MKTHTMLGLAARAVETWLFLATGVSPAAASASMTVTWRTVTSSLSFPPRWLVYRRTTLKRYLLPMIVMVVFEGLPGCAGQSEQHVQFFKAYGAGQVEPRYLA